MWPLECCACPRSDAVACHSSVSSISLSLSRLCLVSACPQVRQRNDWRKSTMRWQRRGRTLRACTHIFDLPCRGRKKVLVDLQNKQIELSDDEDDRSVARLFSSVPRYIKKCIHTDILRSLPHPRLPWRRPLQLKYPCLMLRFLSSHIHLRPQRCPVKQRKLRTIHGPTSSQMLFALIAITCHNVKHAPVVTIKVADVPREAEEVAHDPRPDFVSDVARHLRNEALLHQLLNMWKQYMPLLSSGRTIACRRRATSKGGGKGSQQEARECRQIQSHCQSQSQGQSHREKEISQENTQAR